jgi:protein-disulfide isomerase
MRRYLPFAIIAAVLLVAAGAGALMFQSARQKTSVTPAPSATPDSPRPSGMAKGTVLIEEFGDYQCPPCGSLHPEIKKIKAEYGERIRFIFHHFPLTSIHQNALAASLAAASAGLQNRFWEMHDLLYKNQAAWSEEPDPLPIFVDYARQLGLDLDRFVREMNGAQARADVASDIQLAQSLGVNSTPTVFINGRLVSSEDMTPEGLRREIDRMLSLS